MEEFVQKQGQEFEWSIREEDCGFIVVKDALNNRDIYEYVFGTRELAEKFIIEEKRFFAKYFTMGMKAARYLNFELRINAKIAELEEQLHWIPEYDEYFPEDLSRKLSRLCVIKNRMENRYYSRKLQMKPDVVRFWR